MNVRLLSKEEVDKIQSDCTGGGFTDSSTEEILSLIHTLRQTESRLALAERKAKALDKLEEMSIVYDHVDINGGLTDIEPFRQSKIRLCRYDASLEKTLSTFAPTLLEVIERSAGR